MQNFHRYLVLVFMVLLIIFALYLSCKSKSPTEPEAPSNNPLNSKSPSTTTSTRNTTTTTAIENSTTTVPTTTTTTASRETSTTTSTRNTTTTVQPTTSTTTSVQTTSTTSSTSSITTSVGSPQFEWCSILANGKSINCRDTKALLVKPDEKIIIDLSFKNIGTAPANDVYIRAILASEHPVYSLDLIDCEKYVGGNCDKYIGTIIDNGECIEMKSVFKIHALARFSNYGDGIIDIYLMYEDYARLQCSLYIKIQDS
jgi:hypothetical protein